MRFTYLLSLIGTLVFLNSCHSVISSQKAQSSVLKISPPKIYFGSVEQGAVNRFHIQILNRSDQPIFVGSIQRTCSCTEAELQASTISPNSYTELTGYLDSSGRVGEFGSEITLKFKDGKGNSDEAHIYLGARSVVPIEVSLNFINFPTSFIGDGPISKTLIAAKGGSNVIWDDVVINADHLRISKQLREPGVYHVICTVCPDPFVIGTFYDTVRLQPLSKGQLIANKLLTIPAEWRVDCRGLEVTPKNIYVGLIHPNQVVVYRVRILAAQHAELTAGNIDIDEPSFIHAHFDNQAAGGGLSVNCSVRGDHLKHEINSVINIHITYNGRKLCIIEHLIGLCE